MSTASPELVRYLQDQRLVLDFIFVSAVSVYIYDYLLTLHLEIKLIWFSRWNYTKIIFLVLRYMPFVQIWLTLQNQIFLDVPSKMCETTCPMEVWLILLQMVIAEVILALRTWAIWNRSRAVGILVLLSVLATLVVQCILLNNFIQSFQYKPAPYPGFRGCFTSTTNRVLWINFTFFAVTDAIYLVLLTISAFQSYRLGNFGRLSLIVHRDGIMSYVYLLFISVASVVVTIVLPLGMICVLTHYEHLLYSVLTARIVLNIRETGNRCLQTDLHSVYQDLSTQTPLQFAHPDIYSDSTE